MKTTLISILVLLSSLVAFGQDKKEDVNNRFFDAKIREFVYHLNLTDEQKAKFVPIYKRYNDEMRATVGERQKPAKAATSEEAAAKVKARIENKQKAQNIRLKYVDEFATVLEPKQLDRLFEVESQIQKKLKERKDGHGRGRGRGRGRGNGPGNGPDNGPGFEPNDR